MPFKNCLIQPDCDLPKELQQLVGQALQDWSTAFDALRALETHIKRYVELRLEVAISLLDCFDLVEICAQSSMVPSQKSEWAWHCYNKYFYLLTLIILKAEQNGPVDKEEIPGQLEFLLMKFRYERARRHSVLKKGGLSEFNKAVRAIEHLVRD